MSASDDTGSGLRAALTEALARIAALRDAEASIKTSGPGAINPLDLTFNDPILHGVLPQGPSTRPVPGSPQGSGNERTAGTRPEPR